MKCRLAIAALLLPTLSVSLGGIAAADPEVDRILRRFDHEPSVREVQVAAIRYYNVNPEMIHKLRTRARTKALIPGVSLGFTNTLSSFNRAVDDIVFRARLDESGPAIREDQNADFIGVTASATWNLDRLLFNAEELDVMSLIGIQDGIQREVTALYYVRRRLQIELLLNPPESLQARLSAQLRLEELTGLLDAYTGGFFSKSVGSAPSSSMQPRRIERRRLVETPGSPRSLGMRSSR